MESLNDDIREYRRQLQIGHIQTAYQGIMKFISVLKTHLESNHPDYFTSTLYFGYMDMTYFAFTPVDLKEKKLKIAIVYLHEQGTFEVWLGGSNRQVQAEVSEHLNHRKIGSKYRLSQVQPGVDSIIEMTLAEQPDFDDREGLMEQIELGTIEFVNHARSLLSD